MRIPTYDRQVEEKPAATTGVPNMASPPPSAFGVGSGNVMKETGAAVANIGKSLNEHLIQRAHQEQLSDVLQKDSDFRTDLQTRMFSTETDDNGVPKGVLSRQLGQAKGATQDFDAQYREMRDQYLQSAKSPFQKAKLAQLMDQNYATHRQLVIRHESQEESKNNANILQGNLQARIAQAAAFSQDTKAFTAQLKEGEQLQYAGMKQLGFDDATIANKLDKFSSEMTKAVLLPLLETNPASAQRYFNQIKHNLSPTTQALIQKQITVQTKQFENLHKKLKDTYYDDNMRKAMLDMFNGDLTLSEAQRLYREDILKKSDYNMLEGKLVKPDYTGLNDPTKKSDPVVYNEIRDAQLTGSKSPGEIMRMIAKGGAEGTISPTDGVFLDKVNKNAPPDPRDSHIQSQANSVKDFGNRYFAETLLGFPIKEKKTQSEVDSLVQDFYNRVDKENASGERVDEIANEVMGSFIKKKYPEINRLEDIPHVVVGIDGKVQRLLNPDQKTKLKPRFKISPVKSGTKE